MYIKASSDIFIHYLWGTEKNKDLLLSFINTVLEDSEFKPVKEVEIKNPFNRKKVYFDKETVLDIKATDEEGRQYNIEVQSAGDISFINRSLYYWARVYSSQLDESEIYKKLRPTICINILDFILFKEIEYLHSCFLLREKRDPEYVLTDHIVIHFIELPKLKNKELTSKFEKWLYFLRNEGKEDKYMKILIQEDRDMVKAHGEYNRFTEDEELRQAYEARMKWLKDYNSAIENAREEGIKEGIKEGIEETARKMLKEDISIDVVMKLTGLSRQEIERLR